MQSVTAEPEAQAWAGVSQPAAAQHPIATCSFIIVSYALDQLLKWNSNLKGLIAQLTQHTHSSQDPMACTLIRRQIDHHDKVSTMPCRG